MKRILLVLALAFILPHASPAMADGHGREAGKHYQKYEREDRKFYEKQEQERRKFHEKQEKEKRKFYEKQEREARKHRKKMEKKAKKHRKERNRETGKYDNDYRSYRKEGELPHDWRERVRKDKHIDDDIYIQLQPLPGDVKVALPPLPPGVSYKQIENEILKIDDVNRKILDILEETGLPLPPVPPLPRLK